jgi:hypothetical protein
MDATFKPTDDILKQLVTQRRADVVQLQQRQAQQLQDIETRGQSRIRSLKSVLPKETTALLDKLGKMDEEEQAVSKASLAEIKAKLAASAPSIENTMHPGISGGKLLAPSSVGWFTPYYATLHGSDGSVYWQGYNPGTFRLSDIATGSGPGWFGTGAGSFTVYLDWWFTYRVPDNRFYANTIWVPFNGFYILYSDDGFWDSKEAHARIDLNAYGYQYNYKAGASTNVFDMDSQNINVNDRFDGWRTMYYSDLLGADQAYLLVSASFYVYARGGGSTAELNFSDGSANHIGVPWVYVN